MINIENVFVPVVEEKRFHVITGWGFPSASHGRKASELDKTVKLAAFPPTILGLFVKTCVVVSKADTLSLVSLFPKTVVVSIVRPVSALSLAALLCIVGLTFPTGGLGVMCTLFLCFGGRISLSTVVVGIIVVVMG